jgi:hypothetical protein
MDIMFTIMQHISKEEHYMVCGQAICDRADWLL